MNSDNKQIRDVADVAARIMSGQQPVAEELKGGQVKIDKNHNGKIDGQDFKILRGEKKVKEEVVQEREDDEYHTPTKHHVQVQVSKGDGPKTHRKATVRAKEPEHAVSAAIAHYKQQGYTVHDHKYLGEDVEQIDELSKDTLHSYVKKSFSDKEKSNLNTPERQKGLRKATSRLYKEDEEQIDEVKMADLPSTKVQGRAYGASKPEPHALDLTKGPKDKELKNIDAEKKKKFSEMVNLYQDGGMKSFMESLSKEEEEQLIDDLAKEIADETMDFGEEVDNAQFTKELETNKAKASGKANQPNLAKGDVQAVQQEQTHTKVEFIDYNDVNGVKHSDIELGERHMTDAEMEKREKIVKSMKKGLSGFKERYGDRAKNVMYATANKQAMKD